MHRRSPRVTTLLLAWLVAVAVGQCWLLEYEAGPDGSADAPTGWPGRSSIPRTPGRFTLVLFAHPRCPCTRATLEELAWVVAHSGGEMDAWVVLVRPPGAPAGWERTGLWRIAMATPGVRVRADDSREARRFGAKTSGQTLLYDGRGRLAFRGGITASRGHQGDNAGRRAILDFVGRARTATTDAPVFGCPLFGEDAPCVGGGPPCIR